jgi:hypothetical protein
MRSNRRRNWLIKRIALGFAVAAFVAPAAQARVDEGIQGQPNSASESLKASGYQSFVSDFPSAASLVKASDYNGMPRATMSDYARLNNNGDVRADRPGETLANIGEPQVVRADIPGDTVSDIGNIGTTQVAADSFDWGDAAIGAGLVLLLVLLGGGAALATRHQGREQTA